MRRIIDDSAFAGLIGTPFVSGGESPEDGFDCWGLVRYVFRKCGIELPDYHLASDDNVGFYEAFAAEKKRWKRYEWADMPPTPAVVALRFPAYELVSHVGVYIGDGKFLHTRERIGVAIERVGTIWLRRIEGFYLPLEYAI